MSERETLTDSPRQEALALAERAEWALVEEYQVWRRSWERNPTLDAMKDGILAIRALRKVIEHA